MATKVFYQVRIQEETELGQFNDAIYMLPEEYMLLHQEEIDAMVKDRVSSWISFVKEQSSKPPVPPKPEDLKEQADQLKRQWEQMVTALTAVGTKEDLQAIQTKLAEAVATTATAVEAKPVDAEPIEEEPLIP